MKRADKRAWNKVKKNFGTKNQTKMENQTQATPHSFRTEFKKIATIRAHKKLIQKYQYLARDPSRLESDTFHRKNCPLCNVHYSFAKDCAGCPLANKNGGVGCVEFRSYENVISKVGEKSLRRNTLRGQINRIQSKRACLKRAKFHRRAIKIIEGINPERFTPEGWTYFHELDRNS